LLAVAAAPAGAQDFGYSGELGPEHWAELSAAWTACSAGQEQSPVDFERRARPLRRAATPRIEYGPTRGEIFDNGHTIEVETEGENALHLDGVRYELVQFHFHTPSEHTAEGRGYDMELHLVHRSEGGDLAVLGVFLKRGASSGALAPIFEALPDDVGVHHELEEPFDPSAFLPRRARFHRYAGSLTTPPCREGVAWTVADQPMPVSDEDMARLAERIRFNARPVQRAVR
jgi:carbonic anhydrase